MRKAWWVGICGVGLVVSLALAEPGIVTTRNGQTFEGDVKEDALEITVVGKGMQTRIPRDDVFSIRYTKDVGEVIKEQWGKLKKDDVPGRLGLARKAFDARRYDLANQIANDALNVDPNSAEAVQLLETIRRQAALDRKRVAAAGTPATKPATTQGSLTVPGMTPGEPIEKSFMDARDINMIRQAELSEADAGRVRIQFLNNVRRRFARLPQKDAAAFAAAGTFEQAMTIIHDGDAAMRRDVVIADDPAAIRDFKAFQRQIVLGCAATNCHGTTAGGNFFLYPYTESEAATYTNFYLLAKYSRTVESNTGGIFGGTRLQMLDRQRPGRSLLLQYGLPLNQAETPHPEIKGFRPLFTSVNDQLYGRIATWMGGTLRPIEPHYDVKYVSPLEAQIRPATTQTTQQSQTTP